MVFVVPKDLPEALTDDELCGLLQISRTTLWRELNGKGSRKRHGKKATVGAIRHVLVGGERRWSRDAALAFINGKEER